MTTLSIKYPLNIDDTYGIGMIENIKDLAKQSLKTLLLTNPGEMLFYIEYGIGLESVLFQNTLENPTDYIKSNVYTQTKKYIPFIEITDCQININQNSLYIVVKYYIKTILENDSLELDIERNVR